MTAGIPERVLDPAKMWFRVFGGAETTPTPAQILATGQQFDPGLRGQFAGDLQGWFRATLTTRDGEHLAIERYLAEEEGIRQELNTWAAWLETQEHNPRTHSVMQQVIAARQIFTIEPPADDPEEWLLQLCRGLAQHLAAVTAGIYQWDGAGFFDAQGTLLVREEA